jgi:hypothetical protein
MCRCGKGSVSPSAFSAPGCQKFLAGAGKIKKNFPGVGAFYDCSDRNTQNQIFALTALPVRPFSMSSVPGLVDRMKAEKGQGFRSGVCDQEDIASVSAAASVWPAFWDPPLPPEAHAAVASLARPERHLNPIDKHDNSAVKSGHGEWLEGQAGIDACSPKEIGSIFGHRL